MFREHQPLYKLLSHIPARIHRGVMGYDLSLTCIAAHPRFLALGTNAGLVYWYDRQEDEFHRLWCEDRRTPLTKLALVETVDFMLAAGSNSGCVTIFQIPRPVSPEVISAGLAKEAEVRQTECFTIKQGHACAVTALEWSKNGMKLFSGDSSGKVALSEIDYPSKSSTLAEILEEDGHEVVQLSYAKQMLLVSSIEKTVLINTSSKDSEIIGSKPRKYPGDFGGVLVNNADLRLNQEIEMFAVRPRNTLYHASAQENGENPAVKSTILLKSILERPHLDIPLVNPVIFCQTTENEDEIDEIHWVRLKF